MLVITMEFCVLLLRQNHILDVAVERMARPTPSPGDAITCKDRLCAFGQNNHLDNWGCYSYHATRSTRSTRSKQATFLHCDHFADRIHKEGSATAKVVCMPDSGLFRDYQGCTVPGVCKASYTKI
jgi:hypothetical protein